MSNPKGDAQSPHYAPGGGPGPNVPSMDLTAAELSKPRADVLRVRMRVANAASLQPPPGATRIVWLARWTARSVGDGGATTYRIFYVGAWSVAGGVPTFFSGTGTSANPAVGWPTRLRSIIRSLALPPIRGMTADPFEAFKATQREGWKSFAPLAMTTTPSAAKLVSFAGVRPGQKLLDVGCGTGVVAITARRAGAVVTGLDLTPELLAVAKDNAAVADMDDIVWKQGDVENLPFRDGEFDVVLSQFAHIFAPRPEVAIAEMLRVLKSGGRIAFSTWPPELMIGRMLTLTASYLPPPSDPKPAPPHQWGDPNVVLKRLGTAVRNVTFDRAMQVTPALSPQHYRRMIEQSGGPVVRLLQALKEDPARLAQFRRDYDELVAQYFDGNFVRQDFLMTRATKA